MKKKRYFPLFMDLSDKNIVVVGGGTIATKKSEDSYYYLPEILR